MSVCQAEMWILFNLSQTDLLVCLLLQNILCSDYQMNISSQINRILHYSNKLIFVVVLCEKLSVMHDNEASNTSLIKEI